MKKIILLFVLVSLFSLHSFAQWAYDGTQLSFSPTLDHQMFVSPAAGAGYYITWVSTDSLGSIKLSAYDSTSTLIPGWTSGGIVISEAGDNYAPQIITSEDDGVIVAWYGYAGSNTYSNIYVQKYSSSGNALWNGGAPVDVADNSTHLDKYPIITSDKKKGVFITWSRYDLNLDFDSVTVYLQHLDSTGNVASGWSSTGDIAAGKPFRQNYPQLALTKDLSGIYVVYAAYPDSTHLILNRFNTSDGSISSGWSSLGVTLARGFLLNPGVNTNLWLYTDSLGNATVLWTDSPDSYGVENWVIFMNQVSSTGIPKLGISGTVIGGGPIGGNGMDYLEVKQDKDYNLLVAYNDYNSPDPTGAWLDVMKLTPNSATPLWSKVNILNADYSSYPKAVTDGNKGMFIFYEDVNLNNLHGIALDSTGKIYSGWSAPGPNYGNFFDYDGFNPNYDFSAVPVKPGRAVVAWDRVGTDTFLHIYTCNLNSDGSFCGNSIYTNSNQVETNTEKCIIYPNPFEDYTTVLLSSNLTGNNILKLFDLSGKIVNEYKLNAGGENNINTSQLAQGMYFYQLINNNELIQNGKLVKQ